MESFAHVGKNYSIYIAILVTLLSVVLLYVLYKTHSTREDPEDKNHIEKLMILTVLLLGLTWGLTYFARHHKTVAQITALFDGIMIVGLVINYSMIIDLFKAFSHLMKL